MLAQLILAVQAAPEDEDVVAGWIGFAFFIGLVVAVALLGWSLTRHLRKAERAAAAGVYGPVDDKDETANRADDGS